jgi:hypothetical protein
MCADRQRANNDKQTYALGSAPEMGQICEGHSCGLGSGQGPWVGAGDVWIRPRSR